MSIAKYKGIYRDVYNLHEKYAGVLSEEDFVKLRDEALAISKKYGETKFVTDFIVAVLLETERVYKSEQQENKGGEVNAVK